MMATPAETVDQFSPDQLREWLKQALAGQESLPGVSNDEFPQVSIARLARQLPAVTQEALKQAHLELLQEWAGGPSGAEEYQEELIALTRSFRMPEALQLLASTAKNSDVSLSSTVRQTVLAVLADAQPQQSTIFWIRQFDADQAKFGVAAITALLKTDWRDALDLLPFLPNDEEVADAAAVAVDVNYQRLPLAEQRKLVRALPDVLPRCSESLRPSLEYFLEKNHAAVVRSLRAGLEGVLKDSADAFTDQASLVEDESSKAA